MATRTTRRGDHILEHHKDAVANIDLLIAPHHGRKSGRSYEFLDTLTPTLTFFGNARSQHLAYGAWRNRGLSIVTNNQANCMVVDANTDPMTLYVTHENFARRVNTSTYYSDFFKAWYVGPHYGGPHFMRFEILNVEHGFCAYAVGSDGGVLLFDCGHGSAKPALYLPS